MKYADLTSPEIGRIAPDRIAVLPIAALEQHGNHLPVITDAAIADELGRRVEVLLPDRIVLLPTLWCGSSHHHLGFPGTISISSETYTRVLVDMADSLIASGFRRIFFLNCHGGNQTPFAEALYRLNLKHKGANEPWIAAASYWNLAARELAAQTFMATPRLSHACEYETSLMLALRPDWVQKDALGETSGIGSQYYDPLGYTPSRVVVSQSFDQLSQTGALGSPELATEEKGRQLFTLLASAVARFLEEFATWKRRDFSS
ncbi:creatinine amidohydrolase [Terrimicrobium sacchariphilum]|uniref:Creatinine amidohydrolase n=1 Tax=Terrimicrobium sacchariphilum TaxID=690879 RepID=A0A146GDG9_TERSA|nr:creatininase family protein [Terrimicrobium sacchariphilum]GAT35203.1 creatinine amidohydrolase [Terrimicrobium sacchariphilum]